MLRAVGQRAVIFRPRIFIRCLPALALASPTVQRRSAGKLHLDTPPPLPPASDDKAVPILLEMLAQEDDTQTLLQRISSSEILHQHLSSPYKLMRLAEAVAISSISSQTCRFLTLANLLKYKSKHNAYESPVFHLAQGKQWDLVLQLISLCEEHLGRLTTRLLNWRVRASMEIKDFSHPSLSLEQYTLHKSQPNRQSFHLLITASLRNHDIARARLYMREMRAFGILPDEVTHSLIARNYRDFGRNVDVHVRALTSLTVPPSAVLLNSLLQVYLDAQDTSGAREVLSLYSQDHIGNAIRTLTEANMMPIEDDNKRLFSSTGFHDVPPNPATFSILTNFMLARHSITGAFNILHSLTLAGLSPDVGTVVALIRTLFSAEKTDAAVRVVEEICTRSGCSPALFQSLISSRGPRLQSPCDISAVKPDLKIFNAFLKGIISSRGLDYIVPVIKLIHEHDLTPDATTLRIIVEHLHRVYRYSPPALFRVVRSLLPFSGQPSLSHIHILLSAIIRRERFLVYGAGWDTMAAPHSDRRIAHRPVVSEDRLLGLDSSTLDPMGGLILPEIPKYPKLSRKMIGSIEARNISSDGVILGLRLRHEASVNGDVESAQRTFQLLLDRGFRPNEYHLSALMEGYTRTGDTAAAIDIMNSCPDLGIKPNVVLFTILIVGHARSGNPEAAVRTFQDMVTANIRPDVASIDAVTSGFFAVGSYPTAKRTLITLWPYIQPFPEDIVAASLKELITRFRTLQGVRAGTAKRLTKAERILLHKKLNGIVASFRLLEEKRKSGSRSSQRKYMNDELG